MALKPPKLDRQTLLDRRYERMRAAWRIDGGTSVGFHYKQLLKDARQRYAEKGNTLTADNLLKLNTFDVCHLNHRTNTGEFDTLEWLITLSRQEHLWIDGGEQAPHDLTAEEYKYYLLWSLRNSPKNRWSKPLKLIEKNITVERLEYIRGI